MRSLVLRYSRVNILLYCLPWSLGGVFLRVVQEDWWPQVGGLAMFLSGTVCMVLAFRFRLDVDAGGLHLRYTRTTHTLAWDTIDHRRISHGVGSSRILTGADERGRRRALSLEFFDRSQRKSLAEAIQVAIATDPPVQRRKR